ncbi:hypothetical protein LUZ61_008088 [Rhynchospora tenuis]|uniref:Cathepsin propeptide inhibitor domain-containing protein n=1 Tax=Rhynchospora tenuis TaxID=198213 RepID=A0AAD6EX42_9POAL|nr:hypothetical protein LUZ61_008088 [Rhynchospora tenuis]
MASSSSLSSTIIIGIVVSLLCGASLHLTIASDPLMAIFEKWMVDFDPVYANDVEKLLRFEVFKTNLQYIESTNNQSGLMYKLGLNKFADLTNLEFMTQFASYTPRCKSTPSKYETFVSAPISIDWRSQGAVTPVKDQCSCGGI